MFPDDNDDALTVFDLVIELRDTIKEAREYWHVKQNNHNLSKHNYKPDIDFIVSKTHNGIIAENSNIHKSACEAARWLFAVATNFTWWPRFFRENIDSWTPLTSTYIWNGHKNDLFDRPSEALLFGAQAQIDDAREALGLDYKLVADEVYSLLAIHESWLLLIELLSDKYKQGDQDIIFDRTNYIDKLLRAAENERRKRDLINEIDYEVTAPWSPRKQSLRGKKKAKKEAEDLKDRDKAIRDKVEEFLKNTTRKDHISAKYLYDKVNSQCPYILVKSKTKPDKKLKLRRFTTIIGDLLEVFNKTTKGSHEQ